MNSKYLELVTYIEDVLKNIDQFISGNMILFEEHVQKDCMLDCLLKTREYDGTFQTFIWNSYRLLIQIYSQVHTIKDRLYIY
jgi:hypothetical protein